jgi:hypothetical protein
MNISSIKKAVKILFCSIPFFSLAMLMHVSYAQISYVPDQPSPNGQQPTTYTQEIPQEPAQVPAEQAATVAKSSPADELSKKTNCKPQLEIRCEATVSTTVEFLAYAKHCGELKGWLVHYQPAKWMRFTIDGGTSPGCDILVDDNQVQDQPRKLTCKLNQEQLQQMTSDSALSAAKAFDQNRTNNEAILAISKPIMDCIGPPKKVTGTANTIEELTQ